MLKFYSMILLPVSAVIMAKNKSLRSSSVIADRRRININLLFCFCFLLFGLLTSGWKRREETGSVEAGRGRRKKKTNVLLLVVTYEDQLSRWNGQSSAQSTGEYRFTSTTDVASHKVQTTAQTANEGGGHSLFTGRSPNLNQAADW